MSNWDINCAILREQYPGLLERILQEDPVNVKVEAAASGMPTLVIGGLYVHSPRDPEREGRRLAEAYLAESAAASKDAHSGPSASSEPSSPSAPSALPGPVIFLGFGLGYAAQAFAELAPKLPIIIVEKNAGTLCKALELRDLSSLLSRPAVAFIPGGDSEGIIGALSLFEKSMGSQCAPHIMRNKALCSLDEPWYATAESRIRTWAMRDDINRATLQRFGKRWTRNLSRNMSAIRDLPGIARLAGVAAQNAPLPVFLAAAGPGLDSAASLLPQIARRCITVAVDTSMNFLLRNGIDPDFTLVIDPQFWNSRHFDRCISRRSRLVADSAAYPPVLRLPFRETYLCGSLFPLGSFMEQRVDPKGYLGAGGSVATSAWDFSRMMGAQQIWIAGLDLAFPGYKTHCKGARFEEKALAESGRLNPTETWLVHALRDGVPFNAPSISGGQVLTDRRLSLYAAWFESRFRQFPAIRNYSLCPAEGGIAKGGLAEGGLAIAGLEPAGAEALLTLPERRDEIDSRLEAAFSRIREDFFEPDEARRRGDRYQNAVFALNSGLRQIREMCEKGIQIAEKALRHDPEPAGREKTLAEFDKINRCITGSEVKEIAGFLFPPDALAKNANAGSQDKTAAFRGYMESSLCLYRSLAESAHMAVRVP